MEPLDEVLDAPQRVRIVIGGRGTPKEELCLAATLRALDNGQNVMFISPTSLGSQYIRTVFPQPVDSRITFLTLEWIAAHVFSDRVVDLFKNLHTELIVVNNWYMRHEWNEAHILKVLGEAVKQIPARLLLVSIPTTKRLRQMYEEAETRPQLVASWRWPSPSNYLSGLAEWHFTPDMLTREIHADWPKYVE